MIRTLLATLLLVVATVFTSTSPSTTRAGIIERDMALRAVGPNVSDCYYRGPLAELPSECVVSGDGQFKVTIDAMRGPYSGYDGFDIFIYTDCVVNPGCAPDEQPYVGPSENCEDEIVWPDMDYCQAFANGRGVVGEEIRPHSFFANVAEPTILPRSTFIGPLIELDMRCPAAERYEVKLYYSEYLVAHSTSLSTIKYERMYTMIWYSPLFIDCREVADEPRPTSTPTSRPPTPTPTPTKVARPGDASCNGTADAIDAALTLQFVAGLIGTLPCLQNADVNNDGQADTIDAALILQYAAGLLPQLPI